MHIYGIIHDSIFIMAEYLGWFADLRFVRYSSFRVNIVGEYNLL